MNETVRTIAAVVSVALQILMLHILLTRNPVATPKVRSGNIVRKLK